MVEYSYSPPIKKSFAQLLLDGRETESFGIITRTKLHGKRYYIEISESDPGYCVEVYDAHRNFIEDFPVFEIRLKESEIIALLTDKKRIDQIPKIVSDIVDMQDDEAWFLDPEGPSGSNCPDEVIQEYLKEVEARRNQGCLRQ